jgi:hypothetical protein
MINQPGFDQMWLGSESIIDDGVHDYTTSGLDLGD